MQQSAKRDAQARVECMFFISRFASVITFSAPLLILLFSRPRRTILNLYKCCAAETNEQVLQCQGIRCVCGVGGGGGGVS